MSLTRQLLRLIRAKPVGAADLAAASQIVLDTLACALAGRAAPPARMLSMVAPAAAGDVARRAFLLGGLAHMLEMDDLHRQSVTHPGCVVVPAAWAIADARGVRGRTFLKAVLEGYEACCRIGNAVGKAHYRIWHNTATCGPFGAAMAAASLTGLDEDQTVWALGNAGTQASGLWEFLATGAMSKHLHTARAAESGVLAALLAAEGFTGPERILEGEKGFFAGLCPDAEPAAVLAQPDAPWQLISTSIKPWPCCRHTHPAIDAAIALNAELKGAGVAGVAIGTYGAARDVCDRPAPSDPYSARFSLQHCVASALIDGRIGPVSFEAVAIERMAPLRARITVEVAPELDRAYPSHWGAEIRIETSDGRRLQRLMRDAKGDPENPLTRPELESKARMLLADAGIDDAEAARLIDAVGALAHENAPVTALDILPRLTA